MGGTRHRRRLSRAARCCGGALLALCLATPLYAQPADGTAGPQVPVCEQAAQMAERGHALPAGLLVAIGRVESGRWDPSQGRLVPWPWAINADGAGQLLGSKQAAVAASAKLRADGAHYIDVGCFQIDLTAHPDAFDSLTRAFDPFRNADYAAWFLSDLHARLGSWDSAIAAYHSQRPEHGIPYRLRVFAAWANQDRAPVVGSSGPLLVQFASGAQMRIWTAGSAASAARLVSIGTAPSATLPRVIAGRPPTEAAKPLRKSDDSFCPTASRRRDETISQPLAWLPVPACDRDVPDTVSRTNRLQRTAQPSEEARR